MATSASCSKSPVGPESFWGQGARSIALAWLNRSRIEDGTSDESCGSFLRSGLSAGRQATIIAMLTSSATYSWTAVSWVRSHTWVALLQTLILLISQLGSVVWPVVYAMYCRTIATAQMLGRISPLYVLRRARSLTYKRPVANTMATPSFFFRLICIL